MEFRYVHEHKLLGISWCMCMPALAESSLMRRTLRLKASWYLLLYVYACLGLRCLL